MKKSKRISTNSDRVAKIFCCIATLVISILKGMANYQAFAVEKTKPEARSASLNTEESHTVAANSLI